MLSKHASALQNQIAGYPRFVSKMMPHKKARYMLLQRHNVPFDADNLAALSRAISHVA